MRGSHALPRAAIPYLYRKHLTRDVQTIIIQPQNYRKWADFIWNKVNRTKLFNDVSRPPPQNRCMLTDYLIRKPIVLSVVASQIYLVVVLPLLAQYQLAAAEPHVVSVVALEILNSECCKLRPF